MEFEIIKQCKTLFLDRDGVINVRIIDGYVTKPEEFVFIDGVLDAMMVFSRHFDNIFIVSNQQGIGKGLMTENDLSLVHTFMIDEIKKHGGRITEIFHCPYLAKENHPDRKPDIGMGLQAKCHYPDVDFKNSLMVGDATSDIAFGKNLNMKTVFIGSSKDCSKADLYCNSLYELSMIITKGQ